MAYRKTAKKIANKTGVFAQPPKKCIRVTRVHTPFSASGEVTFFVKTVIVDGSGMRVVYLSSRISLFSGKEPRMENQSAQLDQWAANMAKVFSADVYGEDSPSLATDSFRER